MMTEQKPERSLRVQIATAALARLLVNTTRRFAYPFAAALSRGLGRPLTAVTSLIAVNQATGLLSPFFGPLGDRWGYRPLLLGALAMLTAGMLAGGFIPTYGVVMLALFLAGLCKSIFDPALQAYVSERVPYERRGRVVGLIELSWSGSSLLGIPLMGLLIARQGWRAPFFVLGALGLLSIAAVFVALPAVRRDRPAATTAPRARYAWRRLLNDRAALGALSLGLLVSAANDSLFVVYGAWLEQDFGLNVAAVGLVTTVIGVAEFLGEGLTASLADRLGLRRAVLVGVVLSGLAYIALPILGRSLPLALLGLFITFLTFEFMIVATISLFTEVLPDARATMLSAGIAAFSLGRMLGAMLGGGIWLAGGLLATGLVAAALNACGLLALLWGMREG